MDLAELIPGRVITREEYGAPATPGGARRPRGAVTTYALHWTETPTDRSPAAIREHHVGTNEWADVGYHYLVDVTTGDVIVGRGRYRQGAHAPGANRTAIGVASIAGVGDPMTDLERQAHAGLYAWLSGDGGLVNLRRAVGHRDLSATACPGDERAAWVAEGMPAPDLPSSSRRSYTMMLYAHRGTPDSLAAYTAVSAHNVAAVLTHARGEAREAVDRGEPVVAVGGPAARDLVDDPGVGVETSGDVTTIVGSDRAETLELAVRWAADNL